jgi:hypothetical protein
VGSHFLSTNTTNRPGFDAAEFPMRQSTLKNSSLLAAPLDLFFVCCAGVLPLGQTVASLTLTPDDTAKQENCAL